MMRACWRSPRPASTRSAGRRERLEPHEALRLEGRTLERTVGLEPQRWRDPELRAQGPDETLLDSWALFPALADDRAALDEPAAPVDLDPELVGKLREGADDLFDLARVELRSLEDDEV